MRHRINSLFPLLAGLALAALGPSRAGAEAAPADAGDAERWSLQGQATYVTQYKPAFAAAYSGPNSLGAASANSFTATATAYLGYRASASDELYADVEVTEGVPFSNLDGMAGFTNGELTRTASRSPHAYRQKLFLRHTLGWGGGSQVLESDLNQFAQTVDRNRLVFTVGNFSTLDVFDNNAYAKDPRGQFMNAGFMAPLAYDYAADARGFGWGAAIEAYWQEWTLRAGRMTGPQTPNELPVDFHLARHYGDQLELEHRHALGDLPGAVRLLAWRNQAVLARFDDALAYLLAHPGADPQAIFAVRSAVEAKSGLGLNAEQALTRDLGLFLRYMHADGATETQAFTETDASLSVGLSLAGAAWARPQDTLGLGVLRNTISAARQAYLAAGGISFFLGDGALRYRPEQALELYYSLRLLPRAFLTADLQRVWNPGYNADRGPATFIALRLHAEFNALN